MSIVGRELKDCDGLVCDAGDVDGNDVFRDSSPADVTVALLHLKYLGPQPEATEKTVSVLVVQWERSLSL